MKYDPKKHHRRSIRLKNYDYSQNGLYFITVCCDRRCNPSFYPFGNIEDGQMKLHDSGHMIENEWLSLPDRFKNIQLHEYVVMPNHFHAILEIIPAASVRAPFMGAPFDKMGAPFNKNGTPENNMCTLDTTMGVDNIKYVDNNLINDFDTTMDVDNNQNDIDNKIDAIGIYNGQPQGLPLLGNIIGAFKSIITGNYIRGVNEFGWESFNKKLLQRNFWEHIIRNETSYCYISDYIIKNPETWDNDSLR